MRFYPLRNDLLKVSLNNSETLPMDNDSWLFLKPFDGSFLYGFPLILYFCLNILFWLGLFFFLKGFCAVVQEGSIFLLFKDAG